MLVFITIELIVIFPWSFITCEASFNDWYDNVAMCSVKRIGFSMSKLARLEEDDPTQKLWWENGFVAYFGITVKYLNPFILWFVLLYSIIGNMSSPYGGYAWYWQTAGLMCFWIGLVVFLFFTCFCIEEVKLDEVEFGEDLTPEEIEQYKKDKIAELGYADDAKGDAKVAPEKDMELAAK